MHEIITNDTRTLSDHTHIQRGRGKEGQSCGVRGMYSNGNFGVFFF